MTPVYQSTEPRFMVQLVVDTPSEWSSYTNTIRTLHSLATGNNCSDNGISIVSPFTWGGYRRYIKPHFIFKTIVNYSIYVERIRHLGEEGRRGIHKEWEGGYMHYRGVPRRLIAVDIWGKREEGEYSRNGKGLYA